MHDQKHMATMIGTLTLDDLARIKRMSRTDAESYIQGHVLTDEDKVLVLDKVAGTRIENGSVPRGTVYDPTRPVWFVAAWLAGASWNQLSWLHKVTPQTITASANKIMPSHIRQQMRILPNIPPGRLPEYRAAFLAKDWTGMNPVSIAQALVQSDTDKII